MKMSFEEDEPNFSLSKFESMLKTNKVFFFDSEEFEDIVLHYMDTGRMNLAKKALKLSLEQHPKSTGLKLVQVEMLIYEDKLESAEKILNELKLIEPLNDEIYIQEAAILSKKNNHKSAIIALLKALDLADETADIHAMLGMEYLFEDELELAKEQFIRCLEEDMEDYSALYNIIYCYDFLDQSEDAVIFLESYIDKNPYSEVAWHQLGRQYYALKNYKKAIWAYDYAILIDEQFIGAYLEKAKSLERIKKYEDAIACYHTTIKLDDATAYAHLRIGKCYEKLGNDEHTLLNYLKAVHEDPLLDKGWVALTDFYIKKNQFKKAAHYISKAIETDGQNRFYWKRFAGIHLQLNLLEEAEFGYRKANRFGDNSLETYIFWAETLIILGENEMAIDVLLTASDIHIDNEEIEYRLAGVYYTKKSYTKGKFHLINGLSINPNKVTLLEDFFPSVYARPGVQSIINNF